MSIDEEEDIPELYAELLSCEPAEGDTSFGCIPYEMTFIEFGSVNCIPCKKMQPVMKSIREKYQGKVKVIFCDTRKNRKLARAYNIWIIPTQVFIDADGDEVMRHKGFFPEEKIISFLESQGIEP
jgi:thioredoxin 1